MMARAKQVKAGKDYPQFGIKKGDLHWFAEVMMGPRSSRTIRSIQPIPRSQLTASEFLSTAYDLSDRLDQCDNREDLEAIKDEFEQLGSETSDKLDNMPDGLRDGPTGELLQERVDQCESMVQEIEQALSDLDNIDEDGASDDDVDDDTTVHDQVRKAIEENVSSQF